MSDRRAKALVTGASSGIGAAFARVLAEDGYDLVLVARRRDRLVALAADLSNRFGVEAEVLVADLVNEPDLRAVERRLEDNDDIGLLVNNAGIGDILPFADQSREMHSRMIALNVNAVTSLAHAAVQSMRRVGQGVIINVASAQSFEYRAGASVYAASKAFVLQLTRVLDLELADAGLKFQALVPGLTRTALGGADRNGFFDRIPPHRVMSPEAVARAALASLVLGELVCFPRIEDISEVEEIQNAYRKLGASPDHNRVASRYTAVSARERQRFCRR